MQVSIDTKGYENVLKQIKELEEKISLIVISMCEQIEEIKKLKVDDVLDVKDASKLTGYSEATIREMFNSKYLTCCGAGRRKITTRRNFMEFLHNPEAMAEYDKN